MIYTHPHQPEMQVEVILASQGPSQKPIYTIRMRYPRMIHSEIMTHRVFSRNARSSRAVPVKTMLKEVRTKPFVPWHWGKNQKGMQAEQECDEIVSHPYHPGAHITRENLWRAAANKAADTAEAFMIAGYHKQIANRLLEPFMWIDTLITSTEWSNFLWLRDHKDAEPHLQDLARLVAEALDCIEIQDLEVGQWHLPYITGKDSAAVHMSFGATLLGTRHDGLTETLCKISAARCARISYAPFDGDASYEGELERYSRLVSSDRIHASPLEHQATPDTDVTISSDIFYEPEGDLTPDDTLDTRNGWLAEDLHGNLVGYIQFRKTIPEENHDV